jgi:hypothetical protein
MAPVFSKYLKIYNARQFAESVNEQINSSNVYLMYGRSTSWSNDAAPPQANTTIVTLNEISDYLIAGKKVTQSDIIHVIPRLEWTANTAYAAYDHLMNFDDRQNTKFYCVTTDFNVYKCISNNSGNVSTVMPESLTTTATFETSDGYRWKYMYTVPASERLRFTTSQFVPCKTLPVNDNSLQWAVQEAAKPGTLDRIEVVSGGSGYSNVNAISIIISGDGTAANAKATINNTSNTISSLIIDNPGQNYTYATIEAVGTGSGATFRPVIAPQGGHGSDPIDELNANYLMINMRLRGTDDGNKLPVVNDYRQIALIVDPKAYNSSNLVSNSTIAGYTTLTLSGTSDEYNIDEDVYQGASFSAATFKAKVLQWDSSNSKILLTNVVGTPTADLLSGLQSGAARFVNSVTDPTVHPRTGKLLFIDNLTPITRATDQTEDFKIVLKF